MKASPSIHIDEFCHFSSSVISDDGVQKVERNHPDFGRWREQLIDLGHIKIFQHQSDLKQKVNVRFDDGTVNKYVHHCISLDGEMDAFFQNHNLAAKLSAHSYHQVFVPAEDYMLGMGKKFTNVHIEVERDHYANLLSDSEEWSANLRRKLYDDEVYYPGEFKLSQSMLRVIYEIFHSPLSGYLKKILIEAKVHELIALQLNGSEVSANRKNEAGARDLFHEIRSYLDRTCLEEHSLKSISRQFGVNEFALKKGFKSNFNTTVFEYLLSRRLEHAQQLLLSTSKPVQEISALIGYKYSNHFSVAFKKKFGMSPAAMKA